MAAGILVTATLLAGCGSEPNGRIRRVYELGRSPSEPNKNRIERMVDDRDRDVRVAVLVVMDSIDPARAAKLARARIDDSDGLVRGAAVRILTPLAGSDPEIVRSLVAKASGDSDALVRRRALAALASLDDPAIQAVFAGALADSVRLVRRQALIAGAQRPGLLPLDRVSALVVDDPDWENRVEAAHALGASKDPAAYEALDRAIHDDNEFVRAAATRERRSLQREGVPEPPPPPADEAKAGSGV